MKILALEFSSAQRSVAVVESERPGRGPRFLSEAIETGGRAVKAFELIETALREAQLEREQITEIAIGLGPGSYTGIRATIALAQGWKLACNVRLIGISSMDCLATQAQLEGFTGRVDFVIDAQRNELYFAKYDIGPTTIQRVEPLRLAALAEVQANHKAGAILAGPEVAKWFNAARPLFPRASALGQLAGEKTNSGSADQLEPIYLRETTFVKAPPPRTFS